jgi:hypothetical protein
MPDHNQPLIARIGGASWRLPGRPKRWESVAENGRAKSMQAVPDGCHYPERAKCLRCLSVPEQRAYVCFSGRFLCNRGSRRGVARPLAVRKCACVFKRADAANNRGSIHIPRLNGKRGAAGVRASCAARLALSCALRTPAILLKIQRRAGFNTAAVVRAAQTDETVPDPIRLKGALRTTRN